MWQLYRAGEKVSRNPSSTVIQGSGLMGALPFSILGFPGFPETHLYSAQTGEEESMKKWNFAYMCMVGRGTYGPQDIQDFSHWELETVTWLHLGAGKLGNAVPGCAATSQGHPTLRKGCMKSVGQPPISAIHLLYYQLFEGRIVSFHAFTLVSFIHILRCWHQTDVQ